MHTLPIVSIVFPDLWLVEGIELADLVWNVYTFALTGGLCNTSRLAPYCDTSPTPPPRIGPASFRGSKASTWLLGHHSFELHPSHWRDFGHLVHRPGMGFLEDGSKGCLRIPEWWASWLPRSGILWHASDVLNNFSRNIVLQLYI